MLAMLRHVVYEGLRTRRLRKTWFIHGSRTRGERPFDAELAELARLAGDALGVVRVLSQPEDGAAEGVDYDVRGRIDASLLKAVLPFDDHDVYLCGPAAFTQGLYDELRDLRIPDDRIHAEAFGPSTLVRRPDAGLGPTRPALSPAATGPVHVVFARSAKEARWTPGSGSLLELAEARGLTPEFSCRGGTCGTCRTRILEGQVTYPCQPNAAATAREGLICCAVPAAGEGHDARLVLDL
jgi:ferredoxin-NADP reductase